MSKKVIKTERKEIIEETAKETAKEPAKETGKQAVTAKRALVRKISDTDKWTLSGSLTVEAAVVVPLTLMVIFLLVSLDFYVHDKAYYTLCALETALTGSSYARLEPERGENQAKEKLGSLTKAHRMPTEIPSGNVETSINETKVSFEGAVYRLWGYGAWEYKISETVKTVNPKKRIRQIRMLQNGLQFSNTF